MHYYTSNFTEYLLLDAMTPPFVAWEEDSGRVWVLTISWSSPSVLVAIFCPAKWYIGEEKSVHIYVCPSHIHIVISYVQSLLLSQSIISVHVSLLFQCPHLCQRFIGTGINMRKKLLPLSHNTCYICGKNCPKKIVT